MTKILLIISILVLSACKQDYSLGDASLLYCNSTSQAGRDTLRTVLNTWDWWSGLAFFPLGKITSQKLTQYFFVA